MPPIPIYSNAPINPQTAAAKADGVTPQTAAENNDQQQQGQAPQPTPTRTTATTTAAFDPSNPPPPQPGAVPVPPTQNNPPSSSSYASPPLPQPGAAPVPAPTGSVASPPSSVTKTVTETVTIPSGPPPQFSIPPPQAGSAFAPAGVTRSTSVDSSHHRPTGSGSGPTTINFGAPAGGRARGSSTASLENPPGYTQRNPDGTAAERARLEAAAEQEKEEQGVWGSVKGFAGRVGEGLKKADQEAWRLVGGK